jgi:multiple sugar transport system ATP-binding protein
MSAVAFDGVTKRFGDVVAVDGLSLSVRDGEFMVLLGPSGCGKTTALRMIAGLDSVTEGELRIGDRVVNEVEAKDRDVAMVFQSYALYPHMTVARNIESPLVARKFAVDGDGDGPPRKLTSAERSERVQQAATSLGLTDLLDRKPAALSGGQRQRVALARAMVARPAAFLMDEPLSNLDAKLRAQTRIELVELHQRLSTTFVYVTHDQVEAMTMADRIAVMSEGRLQQVGPPQAVYDRPHNLFVARFIGSPPMNTVPGTVVLTSVGTAVQLGGQTIDIDAVTAEPLAEGTSVIIGVRPEHLVVDPEGQVDADVRAVEWLGHERLVVCDLAGHQITVRQSSGDEPVAAGDRLRLSAEAGQVHLFDPDTTERLN